MHHVRWSAAAVATLAVVLAAPGLAAQKKAPAPPPIPVTAAFVETSESAAVQPTCEFAGSIAPDTGHFTTAPGATCTIAFGVETFAAVAATSDLAPSAGAAGTAVSFFVRNVGRASVDRITPIAGQFGLSWRAPSSESPSVTRPYRLQFGDVYDDSIDYAHTTCTLAAEGTCTQWEVTSTAVDNVATGEGNVRDTGPLARLSVVTGSGAKGVVVLASSLPVHYKLVITRGQPE